MILSKDLWKPEGWKNYFRDIIQTGEDFYCIGGKGGWLDKRTTNYFPQFKKGFEEKKITMWHIFDAEVKESFPQIIQHVGENYRFLPKEFSSNSSADIFGDRVAITSSLDIGSFQEDQFTLTVIVNQQIANAFRTWFRFMYEGCQKESPLL